MGDDDVMRFEITDQDLNDEFDFERRRPRQSKNKATYGIWAENSDEESDDGISHFSGTGGKKLKKGGASYTTPIGFVSAGIVGGKKPKKDENDESENLEEHQSDSDDDEQPPRASFASSSSGNRRKAKVGIRQDGGQIAGMRTKSYQSNISLGKGFGEWEAHTKGIGAKLLLKMGFQAGKGLGKNLQGRSTIVEAHLRKGKGAIGAYGKEGNRPKKVDSEEEEEKEFKEKLHQWRRGTNNSGSGGKTKYVYKSVDDILEEGKWRKIRNTDAGSRGPNKAATKVIDMTGKESRVLSGYHAITSAKHVPDDDVEEPGDDASGFEKLSAGVTHFDLPELTHNLNLIVDMCEESIISTDRSLKHHRDRIQVLTNEEEKLSALVSKEKTEINILNNVLESIQDLETKHAQGSLDLEEALNLFQAMKSRFPEEYVGYELPFIATTIVSPLIKKDLSTWNPLAQPDLKCELFREWKGVLCLLKDYEENNSEGGPEGDPYHHMLWESWMPSVRMAINLWQVRVAPDALINFINAWMDNLIPKWLLDNILMQLVLPKLQNDVELWNPMTDTVPIHSWLHPWLPLLNENLEIVHPTIRNKLGKALTNWDPVDRSAKLILMPWKDVFNRVDMNSFLIKYIVPKLEMTMGSLIINPHNQSLKEWHSVMEWTDLIPPGVLVSIMEKLFFPRWLQVLASWLNHNPNYEEVTNWYQGWKSSIPSEILAHQQIKHQLTIALDMMNRAVGGGGSVPRSGLINSNTPSPPTLKAPPPPTISETVRTASQIPTGFKDLVAKRCEERGILFVPVVPIRYREGKQIFRCGTKLNLYLDRSVIFVHDPQKDIWVPTSLNSLIDSAYASSQ